MGQCTASPSAPTGPGQLYSHNAAGGLSFSHGDDEAEALRFGDGIINRNNEVKFPKRIILVRHGESLGNTDETAYARIPDWKIPLTEKGVQQASELGKNIRQLIGDDAPISIFVSPYKRTQQTLETMLKEMPSNPIMSLREEPRLTGEESERLRFVSYLTYCTVLY